MSSFLSFALCACTLIGTGYFVVTGMRDLESADRIAARPVPVDEAPDHAIDPRLEAPDKRAILARNIFDSQTGPLWPPPPPEPAADGAAQALPPPLPEPGPCEAELRISGSAYVAPGRGRPLVVFSGPDVQHSGARSVGMQIADKTLVAIYPNVAVLQDARGAECWVKMRGPHAAEVAKAERIQATKERAQRYREEARRKAAERRAKRAAKRAARKKR